ncbi:hypothetical protein COB21_05980 [Candidatus Aerophobetes bacterium]|uniref:methylated-DNA--[protein]-cysteine S-methyltransferase n=1 Tax=Aerophobetes bacterium TaxID=2030807 RepID=A0A2A4WZA2_UNCAE|nr:MAG: hypothetical protein COB21_05980 [Candidatus Aerophobetes bacterium]
MSLETKSARSQRLLLKKELGKRGNILKASWLDTPLDPMLAISDSNGLYLLEFVGRKGLQQAIEKLCKEKAATIIFGEPEPMKLIRKELAAYFAGTLKKFETPVHIRGSVFQRKVWQELLNVPYGETKSYLEQAEAIGNKKAVRAVAGANAANRFGIMIPCHRIINTSGELGGYGGGITRKKWLLEHESKMAIV